jgi:Domain of unknown function (DUF4189)
MRRLYILMAAVLLASTLLALTMSSAGAKKSGVTKRYGAMVASPSLIGSWSGYGTSKKGAKHNALLKCRQNAPRFRGFAHDCRPAVWVYKGFMAVAYEKTKEKPYKNLAWGSGWGETKADAKYQARRSCRGTAQESCLVREVRHTSHTGQLKTRGGPW